MQKRGQVTVFVIIGIVVLLAFALVFMIASGKINLEQGPGNIQLRLSNVYDNIKAEQIDKCIDSETKKAIGLILENGGDFEPSNFLIYHGKNYNILCSAIPGKDTCLSNPIFLNVLTEKLNTRLSKSIFTCIDLSGYGGRDYNIDAGDLTADVSIHNSNVVVDVNYPITITSGAVEFKRENFVYTVDIPLGEIIKATNDVLNSESSIGDFDVLSYGFAHLNKYDVFREQLYPNKFYFAGLTDSNYKMKFAVAGENIFEEK